MCMIGIVEIALPLGDTTLSICLVRRRNRERRGNGFNPDNRPDNRIIAGVSSGLAAYFHIEVWIPRLIFALPMILGVISGIFRHVWFDFDGKYIRVNSARGRVKDKNMRRDPRVALSILDPDNPYRYLSIRGRVIKITETGAVEHINALARKYRGMDIYRSPRPDEVRVMYVIEPRRVAGQS